MALSPPNRDQINPSTPAAPTAQTRQQPGGDVVQWFQSWMQQHGIPSQFGTAEDPAQFYQQFVDAGEDPEQAKTHALSYLGWDTYQAPQQQQQSSGGGGGYSGPSLTDPFTQQFHAPDPVNLGGPAGIPYVPQTPNYTAPTFRAPDYKPPPEFHYDPFVGPDAKSVLSTPGYQFRLNQGEQALTNSRAAQGILGTGATLKDILGYGQDYASNEFGNEWNRELTGYQTNRANALDSYNTNYGTQYVDPYKFAYQGALDAFAPQMAQFQANVGAGNLGYSTQAAAGQHQTDQNTSNAWNQYLFDYNNQRNQRLDTFNMWNSVLGQ